MPETNPITPANTPNQPTGNRTPLPQPQTQTSANTTNPANADNKLQQPNQATGRHYLATRGFAGGKDLKDAMSGGKKDPTILKQEFDPRFDPPYTPLKILFSSGRFKGLYLDLGFNVQEFSESQTAEWSDQQGNAIRVGSNFVNISPRTFQVSVEFSALNEDVRQISEAVAHLQEITQQDWTPPLLTLFIGSTTITPVVCTSFDIRYDEPLPRYKGWRHGTVNFSFKLLGGQGSAHQLAPPLLSTNTYLEKHINGLTDEERRKAGDKEVARQVLADCLGEEGNSKVQDLLDRNATNNPDELLKLDPRTFLQMVTAGMAGKAIEDPRIKEKIQKDLALLIVMDRSGMNPVYIREVANAIFTGNSSTLPESMTRQFPIATQVITGKDKDTGAPIFTTQTVMKSEYELILDDYSVIADALQKQKLEANDSVFDRNKNPTASQALSRSLGCGLSLRRLGAPALSETSETDQAMINGINQALANNDLKDAELLRLFGLDPNTPETIIRQLRNGGPYKTKDDFMQKAAPNRQGITSRVMWQNFNNNEAVTLARINEILKNPEIKDEDIKKMFGAKDAEIALIRNGGSPFKSKQEFLEKLAQGDTPTTGRGNPLWEKFRLWSLRNPPKTEA